MKPSSPRQRADLKARRREILSRLAAAGLSPGRFPRAVRTADATPPAVRLRAALADLGGVLVCWGRYLSSRFDLATEDAIHHFASLPDQRPPTPGDEIRRCVEEELGKPVAEVFEDFEPAPASSSWLYQDHLACRSPDGSPVVVRVVQPALAAELDRDLAHLPLLDRALEECGVAVAGLDAARADFAESIRAAIDLRDASEILDDARGEPVSAHLRLPRIEHGCSASKVLTFERLRGMTLAELSAGPLAASGTGAAALLGRPAGEQLASRLCQAWLRLALRRGVVACELRPADLRILPELRIAWTGSEAWRLSPGSRTNLWEYLTASAAQDPDRACAALLRELDGGEGDLQRRFRQLIPFRDGGPEARDDLAGYVLLHWRLALRAGYRPRSGLTAFYRGLGQLMLRSRQLGRGGDPLRDGLEAVQLADGLGEWARLGDPAAARALAGSAVAALLTLPQKLDEMLTLASEGKAAVKLRRVEPPSARRRRDASTSVIAALLTLVAVILLSRHLVAVGLSETWVERTTTVLVVVLGLHVLRGVSPWK